ncbi:hypothetical protein [Siccirubricoccus deserti]|uniref:Uncharacterized protein n=1 Tax=Siccirubricoccus deserti TaxID=2013562 RepID=A0A9X0R2L4_9PROT|nr:hypothetical protein [Siccirubricoccus deserti]MBC4018651.1 hypothetical protein [Siccirubricoccus deserti]
MHAGTNRSGGGSQASPPLFPTVPAEAVVAAYAKAPGNEFSSGKIASPESSAALVANAFGFFLLRPADLPKLPSIPAEVEWPPTRIGLEKCVRFPWRGGLHPWLDALVDTPSHIVGVESKRYEPFRPRKPPVFSDAYWGDVWGGAMAPFLAMRDRLRDVPSAYLHLDAAQLVKHALGLRTMAKGSGKRPFLLYLHAEPLAWPNGTPVPPDRIRRHAEEAASFAEAVRGAEVEFATATYAELLAAMRGSGVPEVRRHAEDLTGLLAVSPGRSGGVALEVGGQGGPSHP